MKVLRSAYEMRDWSLARRAEGKTVGFTPTMGALHEGHASLMRASVEQNDCSVLSIFVNPTQFAPNEDFDAYPRTFETDQALAEQTGIDAIYAPRASDMYPDGYSSYVLVEHVSEGLCGASRPHFFRGVCTVVTKLFLAVYPHRAYFGQKDAQQAAVIRRMTRDLDFGIEIVVLPIIREPDGLAMSSRNAYLSSQERQQALCLNTALLAGQKSMQTGERDAVKVKKVVQDIMTDVCIDYIALVDADDMTPLETVRGRVLLAVAAWAGKTRLIDNIIFDADASSTVSGV